MINNNLINIPYSEHLNIKPLANSLKGNLMTNSYKVYWIYSINEIINKEISFSEDLEVEIDDMVIQMIAKAWYTIIEYKISLGKQDKLQELVIEIHKEYSIPKVLSENEVVFELTKLKENVEFKKKIKRIGKYVPYRFLTSYYPKQLAGQKDELKNFMIVELSDSDTEYFYKFDNEKIKINKEWCKYFKKNYIILRGWILYELIIFLQNRNPGIPGISNKLEAPISRDLLPARRLFSNIILNNPKVINIYTGDVIDLKDISIDHFIPWSFCSHDEIWNLIPVDKTTNSKKSNKLPSLENFLEKFCEIQYLTFDYLRNSNQKIDGKILESYSNLLKNKQLKNIEKEYFIKRIKNEVIPMYQIAENSGFDIWNQ